MYIVFGSLEPGPAASDHLEEAEGHGDERLRLCIRIFGLVQGVGFRPFVRRLAERVGVSGVVRNTVGGVEIEAEGSAKQVLTLLSTVQV